MTVDDRLSAEELVERMTALARYLKGIDVRRDEEDA